MATIYYAASCCSRVKCSGKEEEWNVDRPAGPVPATICAVLTVYSLQCMGKEQRTHCTVLAIAGEVSVLCVCIR